MKKLTFTVLVVLVAFFIIQSCNKDVLPVINASALKATKTKIKVGEQDSLLFTTAKPTDSLTWTIPVSDVNSFYRRENGAVISFSKAGTYVVSVKETYGGPSSSVTIKVTPADTPVDTVKTPTDTTKYVPLTGDNISLGLGVGRNINGGDTVVVNFNAITTNTYCSRGVLQYQFSRPTINGVGGYKVDFLNVREPTVCSNAPDIQMAASNIFYSGARLAVGSHPLVFTLNGTTYTGSIVVSETNVTVVWNYTTGIIIPYKALDRPL